MSSTRLKTILQSPAAFRAAFLSTKDETTKSMELGRLIHHALLEGEDFVKRHVVVPDFGDMRSSTNRGKRDAWKAEQPEGTVFVTQDERDMIRGIIEAVFEHEDASNLLRNGSCSFEVSGYYTDPETGIRLRIRPDILNLNLMANVDLKKTRSTAPRAFARQVHELGYYFQQAMYCEGIKIITGKNVEFPAWIAVEDEPPYEVAVYVADDEMMEAGRAQYRKALTILHVCLEGEFWPRRQSRAENISLPSYAQGLS